MVEILGYIGFIITILVIVPASLVALIKVFTDPVREILNLWYSLVDTVIDIVESFKSLK